MPVLSAAQGMTPGHNQPRPRPQPTAPMSTPTGASSPVLPPIPPGPGDPPGPGWKWRGPDAPGGPKGGWKSPDGGSIHWDPKPHGPIGPHWDWTDPYGNKYRHDPTTGKWHPDKDNNPNKPQPIFPPGTVGTTGFVIVGGCLYFLYRTGRLGPSLMPPLWWTLPVNILAP
jgi:hypothetical protein